MEEEVRAELQAEYEHLMNRLVKVGNMIAGYDNVFKCPTEVLVRMHNAMREYAKTLELCAKYEEIVLSFSMKKGE